MLNESTWGTEPASIREKHAVQVHAVRCSKRADMDAHDDTPLLMNIRRRTDQSGATLPWVGPLNQLNSSSSIGSRSNFGNLLVTPN